MDASQFVSRSAESHLSISSWEQARRFVSAEAQPEKPSKGKTRFNSRLTALAGLLLFALLALEGVTVPFVGKLLTLHVFIGWVLLPPILLKLASVTYRFVMYYTGNPAYVKAGPPKPYLRLLAPVIVLTTAILMWSGIEMVMIGPTGSGIRLWSTIHKASFVLWFIVMAVHVLSYFLKASTVSLPDLARRSGAHTSRTPGKALRIVLVIGSLVVGVALGIHEWPHATAWVAQMTNRRKLG